VTNILKKFVEAEMFFIINLQAFKALLYLSQKIHGITARHGLEGCA